MTTTLSGVLAALSTPFAEAGDVDVPTLRFHVERLIDAGVHGLVPCGSTGEFAALTLDERKEITRVVCDQAAGRVSVVPQTGATRTADAIDLTADAARHGADAVLVVQPFYEAPTTDEIVGYFAAVGGASDLPVVVYNLPSATGVNLTPDLLLRLATEIKQVRYVKDSSGDLEQAYDLIYHHADTITPLIGWDTILLPALAAGAAGTIWGAPNFMPYECVQLWSDATEGRLDDAQQLWNRMWPVQQFLVREGYAASVKAAAELMGTPLGAPRPPFSRLPQDRRDALRIVLERAGLLKIPAAT